MQKSQVHWQVHSFYRSTQGTVDYSNKLVTKLLEKREAIWTENQKKKMLDKANENWRRLKNVNIMIRKLLMDCKSWDGPSTSSEYLFEVIQFKKHLLFKPSFVNTHKADKFQRPELYRQDGISQEEKLDNLCILQTDDAELIYQPMRR